jgi:hypothetical protein
MRAYWILPNRDQSDTVLASDGETILPLREILDPKLRPAGFSHGVPTELLEKCGSEGRASILFAQRFSGWNGDQEILSVSTPAGVDLSGRVVHLGLLLILEPQERPRFELSHAALSKEDQTCASALIRRLTSSRRGDPWVQSVRDLIALPADGRPATNVALDRSVVGFRSLYTVSPRGLIKKGANWRSSRKSAIVLLILITVVGACLSVRACEQASRPVVSRGVAGT